MRWSSIFLLIFIAITTFFFFAILNLNNNVIRIDLLFYELDINTGFMLLIFFLAGIFTTLFFEILYFYSKKVKNK